MPLGKGIAPSPDWKPLDVVRQGKVVVASGQTGETVSSAARMKAWATSSSGP